MSGFLLSVSAGLPGSFDHYSLPIRSGAQTGFLFHITS